MEKIIEAVKAHPVPIVAGVVILLLLMNRGSAASNGSSAGAYLQAQSIAAGTNVQIASLNTQAGVAFGAQSVEKYSIAEKAATDRAGIVASLFSTVTGVNAQLAAASGENTVKTVVASMTHKENMQSIADKFATDQNTIAANIQINGDKLSAAQKALETDNNFKLKQIGEQTNGVLAMMGKQQDFQLQTLPMALQHEETMAKITGQNALNIVNVTSHAQNTVADANARATNAKTTQGWIGSIANIIGSLFG